MLTKRNLPTADDADSTVDLVAGYNATQVPSGSRGTGLPMPQVSEAEPSIEVSAAPQRRPEHDAAGREMHPVAERRTDRRLKATFPVSASYPGSDDDVDGVTVDVSMSGMCLLMPSPPTVTHQDILVDSGDEEPRLWVQVLDDRPAPDGGHYWHVRVAATDESWLTLIDRLSAAPASSSRPQRPRRAADRGALETLLRGTAGG